MDVTKQVFKSGDVSFVIIGLVCVILAIVIGVFKQHWPIAGVNTMPKKELAKMDLEYVCKYFGIFFGIYGFFAMLSPFIFNYLCMKCEYRALIFLVLTFSFCIFMSWYFNVPKKNRVYKKK